MRSGWCISGDTVTALHLRCTVEHCPCKCGHAGDLEQLARNLGLVLPDVDTPPTSQLEAGDVGGAVEEFEEQRLPDALVGVDEAVVPVVQADEVSSHV